MNFLLDLWREEETHLHFLLLFHFSLNTTENCMDIKNSNLKNNYHSYSGKYFIHDRKRSIFAIFIIVVR